MKRPDLFFIITIPGKGDRPEYRWVVRPGINRDGYYAPGEAHCTRTHPGSDGVAGSWEHCARIMGVSPTPVPETLLRAWGDE